MNEISVLKNNAFCTFNFLPKIPEKYSWSFSRDSNELLETREKPTKGCTLNKEENMTGTNQNCSGHDFNQIALSLPDCNVVYLEGCKIQNVYTVF